jgi:hypothetical protein
MNQIRIIGLVLIFALMSDFSYGQIQNLRGNAGEVIMKKRFSSVEGSAYIFNDWRRGTVVDIDGKKYTNVLVNYNSMDDLFEILHEGKELTLDRNFYQEIHIVDDSDKINSKVRKFKLGFDIDGFSANNYFEVLYEGKNLLLLRRYSTGVIQETVPGYGTAEQVRKFLTKEQVIYVRDGQEPEELKGSKKSIISAFGNYSEKIRDFAKKEKLNVKNEEDLLLAVIYLDDALNSGSKSNSGN